MFTPKLKIAEVFFIKNLLVIFGGESPERDISVLTGILVYNSVDKSIYNPIPIFWSGEGIFFTGEEAGQIEFYKNPDYLKLERVNFLLGEKTIEVKKGKKNKRLNIYCAINCTHGVGGEDGNLVGLMNMCKIPILSPDLFASSVAIDKEFTKIVLKSLNINYAPYLKVERDDFFKKSRLFCKYIIKKLGLPVIVKPARLGSSIGIVKVDRENALFSALCEAFNYDGKVICEKYVKEAKDVNCAVYLLKGNLIASKLEQAMHTDEILSFADKYGNGQKVVGCDRISAEYLAKEVKEKISNISKTLYKKLGFSSIVRFDFLVSENEIYLNEINAVPGSLAYYLFCDKISDFSLLLSELIEDAVFKKQKSTNFTKVFNSGILKGEFKSIKK